MATMTQGTLSNLFDEIVTAVNLESAFDIGQAVGPALYAMRAASGRRERLASFSDLGAYQAKAETAAMTEDSVAQQFTKTFVPSALGLQTVISREVRDDEEWGFVARMAANHGSAFNQTVETDMAAPFIDAFAGATYLTEGGLSLCNDAHVNAAGGNSQDNKGTAALSMAAVKAALIASKKFKDYRGTKNAKSKMRVILHPVDLAEEAAEISKSLQRPDSANNAVNYYNGLETLEWDELTSTTDWFLIDPKKMKQDENLLWLWRTSYEMATDSDFFNGTMRMGGYYRADHGVVDWRWVYGSDVG